MPSEPSPSSAQSRMGLLYLRAVFRHWALWREGMGNFHQVSSRLFRSGQPTPRQLTVRQRKYGFKTLVNLRGAIPGDAFLAMERHWCDCNGVKMETLRMYSRRVPDGEELQRIRALMERIAYPALIHCKGGSDRAGLFATLYLHWMEKEPMEEAMRQMNFWPYLHFKSGKTGRLDFFFETYLAYHKAHPETDLMTWATEVLDREALQARFQPRACTDFLLDAVFRRE